MKKQLVSVLVLVSLIAMVLASCVPTPAEPPAPAEPAAAPAETEGKRVLRVGMNADSPPFGYMENGELVGMEIDLYKEVAKRMETNRNALYKLIHDARKRLQEALEVKTGLSVQDLMILFEQ